MYQVGCVYYVYTNVLVFECADVGLKDVNRQTDGQTGTQSDRQNTVLCTYTNTNVKTLLVETRILVMLIITKDDGIPRASLICIP
jgi:hypothetical protein